jgi:hypothetical protein
VLVDVGEPEQRPVQDPLLDDWIILVEDVPEDLLVEGDRLAPVPHPDDSALKLHLALQAVHGVDQRKALKVSGHVSSQGSLNVLSTLIVIVHQANVSQLSEIIRAAHDDVKKRLPSTARVAEVRDLGRDRSPSGAAECRLADPHVSLLKIRFGCRRPPLHLLLRP